MEKKNKITGILVNVVLVVSIGLFAIALVKYLKNNGEVDKEFLFGVKPLYVTTDTMEPYIREKSLLFAKKYSFDEVKNGDVILYYHDEKLFTHRVIEVLDDGLRTQGDNSDQMDAYTVTPSEVIGIVALRLNFVAAFLIWLEKDANWLVFLGIIILGIAIIVVSNILIKTIKKNKKDNLSVNVAADNVPVQPVNIVPDKPVMRRAANYEETQITVYLPDKLTKRKGR